MSVSGIQLLEQPEAGGLDKIVEAPAAGWFALYTLTRHEKSVARILEQRQIDHFLPLYRAERKWKDGSRVKLELPLFPGYLFVRISRSEKVRVLQVPGALAVVSGVKGEPAPLPEDVILTLRSSLESYAAEPHPLLTAGQRVKIRCGALAGWEGVVMRLKGKTRVILTLEQIMRSISVEVGFDDLELLMA